MQELMEYDVVSWDFCVICKIRTLLISRKFKDMLFSFPSDPVWMGKAFGE